MWPFLSYANLTVLLRHSNKVLERICSYVCDGPHSISGWVVLANKRHRMSICSTALVQVSWFFLLMIHCLPHPFVPLSFNSISLYIWLAISQLLLNFCCLSGIVHSAEDIEVRGPDPDSGVPIWVCVCVGGDEPKTAALILPWISSLLVFPTDFRLVSPQSCVSQFLKISLLICVYTYIIHT